MKEFEQNEKEIEKDYIPTQHQKTIGALLLIFVLATFYIVLRSIVFSSADFTISEAPVIAYFTIQTNIMACIWLGSMVVYIMTGKKRWRFAVNINLGAALTTYSAVNALIFWIVLVPTFSVSSYVPLFTAQNMWLHTTTPIIAAIMLNYAAKGSKKDKHEPKLIMSLIYPILYIIFAVIYAVKGIYLYPMLNPSLLGGWIGVGACMVSTLIFVAIIYIVINKAIKSSIE